MKPSNILPWIIIIVVGYFLIQQISFFNFTPDFPFVKMKFKESIIVENDEKIREANKIAEELRQKEAQYLLLITHQKQSIVSLQSEISAIRAATQNNTATLNESFLKDSANTRLEYRKRMQWFGWLPDIPVGPLTFRETGIGAILFEELYGTEKELGLQIDINLSQDSIITDYEFILEGRKQLAKQDSVVIASLIEQKNALQYPYSMEISGGVKSIYFNTELAAALFAKYKYKAINTERFELYISGEGNYSNYGIGAEAETGITYKFGL